MNKTQSQYPIDEHIREQAIQIEKSFIVQAPAGSGKTGLLTQRYLKLLSVINRPEEIIAITFTRKAASEMRDRIFTALQTASVSNVEPEDGYLKKTWRLARAALKQNQKMNWNLLEHSSRLRVQTIDSLCVELARQLPLLSEFGAVPEIKDDASELYSEAALETLSFLESNNPDFLWVSEALAILLQHQDNRLDKLQEMIAVMLQHRDQWLRHVADLDHPQLRRDQIEPVLKQIIEDSLKSLKRKLPEIVLTELPKLLNFAAQNVTEDSILHCCIDLHDIPKASVSDLPKWYAILELLLTRDNLWRKPKGVNKKIGFLAESDASSKEQKVLFKSYKSKFQLLLQSLENLEQGDFFKKNLMNLRVLPNYKYSDQEWLVLESLFKVLLFSAAQLKSVFSHTGNVDFIEMLLAAKRALSDNEHVTDLSLRLDNQLKHLLVDEFQDTSQNQFDLFVQLTLGWQTGDGRSLFLVGDPMQSIYRFREAEVGLFIEAWENGIGDVILEPLTLNVNFRSQQAIVDWINEKFPIIFPAQNDKTVAAVSYTSFKAFRAITEESAVLVHPLFDRNDKQEAALILNLITQTWKRNPSEKIALLCRNKSHLHEIISLLNKKLIPFQAIEIDKLNTEPVIQDLLALTKALLHLADKISWLALLRAPFIGFTLNDILIIAAEHASETIFQSLVAATVFDKLSLDGQQRIYRILPILEYAIQNRFRGSLRSWIESVWLALGAPACYLTEKQKLNAEVYLQLLESLQNQHLELDILSLDNYCNKLFSLPDVHANESLQLMTIHKSKGLEFDTVIIPGIGKITASDKSKLLYWCERTNENGNPELIFSPIKPIWEDNNKTTEYLKHLEKEKKAYEICRLLYVAVTRAKNCLHLIGHVNIKSDASMGLPLSNSLLHHLWPIAEQYFITKFQLLVIENDSEIKNNSSIEIIKKDVQFKNTSRNRLHANWICPTPPANIEIFNSLESEEIEVVKLEFDWASETALHVGSVVHAMLELLTTHYDVSDDNSGFITQITERCKIMLVRLGVVDEQLQIALDKVMMAIKNTLSDKRGLWILSQLHQDAHSEYKITAVIENEVKHMVIDRTFIDNNNIRWVIDYKTGSHLGAGLEEFLDREQQRYFQQLHRYASVMSLKDDCEVKMALYFPMLQQWREW